jgi:hypothetical protein
VIRGNIQTPEDLEDVLKRRKDLIYFMYIAWDDQGGGSTEESRIALFDYLKTNYPVARKIAAEMVFFRLQ